MGQIIPRWEWRTFGTEFGPAEARFAAISPEKVQKGDEIYLLSTGSDANVKIRDQLLNIKLLEHVDSTGLEQWRPVLKEPFPMSPRAIGQLCAALGISADGIKGSLPLDQLLDAMASGNESVRIINVSKTRTRYHVLGCVAELTDVIADGKPVRTVAIEDADPARAIAAVRSMELARFDNISYPRGLKKLLGM